MALLNAADWLPWRPHAALEVIDGSNLRHLFQTTFLWVFFFLFYSRLSLDRLSGFRDGCELSIYSSIFQASSTSQDHIQGPFTFTPMVDHVRFTFSLSGMSLGCGTEPTHKLHTEINRWSPCCRGRCSTNIGHRGRHSPHLEISGGWAHSDVFF